MTVASLTHHAVRQKAALPKLSKLPLKMLYGVGGILLSLAFVFYVLEMNSLIVGTYTLREYQETLNGLTKENRELEAQLAERGFLSDIQDKAVGLQFEKATGVTYIKVLEDYLTMAK